MVLATSEGTRKAKLYHCLLAAQRLKLERIDRYMFTPADAIGSQSQENKTRPLLRSAKVNTLGSSGYDDFAMTYARLSNRDVPPVKPSIGACKRRSEIVARSTSLCSFMSVKGLPSCPANTPRPQMPTCTSRTLTITGVGAQFIAPAGKGGRGGLGAK